MSTLAIARLLGGSRGQGRHFVTVGQSLMGREIVCLVIVVVSCSGLVSEFQFHCNFHYTYNVYIITPVSI